MGLSEARKKSCFALICNMFIANRRIYFFFLSAMSSLSDLLLLLFNYSVPKSKNNQASNCISFSTEDCICSSKGSASFS